MVRMLGRAQGSHCPSCHGRPGVDCNDKGTSTRHQKRIERREWTHEAIMEVAREQIDRWRGALDALAAYDHLAGGEPDASEPQRP